MKRFLRIAMVVYALGMTFTAQSQTYCTYLFGFSGCWTGVGGSAIDDITFGSFTEMNSGCNNGVYSDQSSTSMTVTKGTSVPFSLATDGGSVQWGIWIDSNADGDFTDAGDVFWGSSSASSSVSGNILIPSSIGVASSRIRFKSSGGAAFAKSDACSWPLSTETQDFGILFNAAGGCNIPTSLAAAATSTNALLSWDSVGTLYNVEWDTTGFSRGLGNSFSVTTDTTTISSLSPNTFYDFYVQSDCSASTGDSSAWNGPYTFKTACVEISTYPYTESFEGTDWVANSGNSYTSDQISTCWDRFPLYNWNYSWLVRTGATPSSNTGPSGAYGSGSNYMHIENFGNFGDEAFFTSSLFDLTSLTSPYLTFQYHMYGSDIGKLFVEVSTNSGATWTVVDSLIGEQHISENSAWLERGVDLTSYKTANTQFRFKAIHAPGYGQYGDIAIDHIRVAEIPACPKVSSVTFSNITGSSVDIDFTSIGSSVFVEIGPIGFTQGTGMMDTSTTGSSSFDGLFGNTFYEVYLQTDCGINGSSSWAGPYTFKTLVRPTWLEDFADGFVPNVSWLKGIGQIANPTVFTATYSGWYEDGWLNNGYDGSVRINFPSYNTTTNEWFFTELIDLGNGSQSWELHFDMAATAAGTSGSANMGPDDTIKVVISTDGGNTWYDNNTIYSIHSGTGLNNVGGTYIVDLTGYTGIVKFGFYAESSMANTQSVDVFLDDLGIRPRSGCPTPSAINAYNITDVSMTIGWSGDTAVSTYEIEYGPSGFAQGTGMMVNGITSDTAGISNLSPVTLYDIYIRSICSGGDTSIWAGPLTVQSGCPAIFSTPYYTSFDNNSLGAPNPIDGKWENCWVSDNQGQYEFQWRSGNGKSTWVQTGPEADHTQQIALGDGKYMYSEASHTGLDAHFTNGPFDLSSLNTPSLSFYYHMFGSDMGTLQIEVARYSNPDVWNVLDDIVGQQQTASTDAWILKEIALSSYVNDTILVRFKAIKGGGSNGDMAIDDFRIREANSCVSPAALGASNITTNSANLFWGSYASSHTIEWGPAGFIQGTGGGTIVNGITSSSYGLTGLTPNTAYDFYVKDTCVIGNWSGPFTFNTECTASLSGSYTVGGSAGPTNFATLDSAFTTLNSCGVSGPVTLNLQGGTHIGSYEFGAIDGVSSSNTITINGSGISNDTIRVITGDYALGFNGTSYIHIKNLTIFGHIANQLIWLTNESHDITIEDCRLIGQTVNPVYTSSVISASLFSNVSSGLGSNAHHIYIMNNEIAGGSYGVCIVGKASSHMNNVLIENNIFRDQDAYGVNLRYMDSVVVKGNYMYDTQSNFSGYGASFSYVNEFEIKQNYFAAKSNGIYLSNCNLSVSQNSEVSNNMIIGLNTATGLSLSNSNNLNIYHNSIKSGNYGLYLYSSSSSTNLDMRNNIFYGVGSQEAIYLNASVSSNSIIDNNVYFAPNATNLFNINSTFYADLLAWQAADTSWNINSLEGDPGYKSVVDMHIVGTLPNDVGDNSVNLSVDYDGDSRPASGSTTVDIGADEFTPKNNDAVLLTFLTPQSGCGDSIVDVVVVITNYGTNAITSLPLTANISGGINTTLNGTYTGNIGNREIDTVVVGSFNSFTGGQNIMVTAYSSLLNDEDNSNDTIQTGPLFYIPNSPQAYSVTDTICYNPNDTAFLAAISYEGVDYNWYTSLTDTVPYATGDTLSFPMSTQTDWYLGYDEGKSDSLTIFYFVNQFGGSGGIMYDITAKSNIYIDGFDLNSRTNVNDSAELKLYIIPNGTYDGNETDPSKWILWETIPYVGLGTGNAIPVTLSNPLNIPVGSTYGIYMEYNCAWGNGNPGIIPAYNSLFIYDGGTGLYSSFSSTSFDRVFDGVIRAHSESCSDTRTMVGLNIYSDTAHAVIDSVIVQQPNKVVVDGSSSVGQMITWYYGDGNQSQGANSTHTYTQGGTYTIVCVVEDTVCNTIDSATYVVSMTIGIDESLLNQSMNVYPNPNNGNFNISFELDQTQDIEISILDAVGRVVYNRDLGEVRGTHTEELNLSNEARGLYIVQIQTENNVVTRKITVQ